MATMPSRLTDTMSVRLNIALARASEGGFYKITLTPATNTDTLRARGFDVKDLGFADYKEEGEKRKILERMRRLNKK